MRARLYLSLLPSLPAALFVSGVALASITPMGASVPAKDLADPENTPTATPTPTTWMTHGPVVAR